MISKAGVGNDPGFFMICAINNDQSVNVQVILIVWVVKCHSINKD